MESSPPLPYRRDAEMAFSPARSEYSLDLNALSLDDHSGPSSPLPTQQIDQVHSEDIDGPSDFTINMGQWMRGTPQKNGSRNSTLNRKLFGSVRRGRAFQDADNTRVEAGDNQLDAVKEAEEGESTHEPEHQNEHDQHAELPQTAPEDVPLPDGPLTDAIEEGGNSPKPGEDDSIWDPYRKSSSPPSPIKRGNTLLQPTVEDYNSEMSPSRPLSAAPPTPQPPKELVVPEVAPAQALDSNEASEPEANAKELSDLRAQIADLRTLQEETTKKAEALQDQLREANDTYLSMTLELDATKAQAHIEAQKAAENAAEQDAQFNRQQLSLQEAQNKERQATERLTALQKELEDMHESEDAELHDLRWKCKSAKETESKLTQALDDTKSQLATSQAEKTQLQQTLDSAKQSHTSAMEALHTSHAVALQSHSQYHSQTQTQNEALTATLEAKTHALTRAEAQIKSLQEDLELAQHFSHLNVSEDEETTPRKHGRDTSTTTASSTLVSATAEAELRAHLATATTALTTAQTAADERLEMLKELRAQLDALKSSLPDTNTPDETEAEKLRMELQTSERARLELHSRFEALTAEVDGMKETNRSFDLKLAEHMRKREENWRSKERKWKGRIVEMEEERKVLSKALMRQWGREEVGGITLEKELREGQGFKYAYAVSSQGQKA